MALVRLLILLHLVRFVKSTQVAAMTTWIAQTATQQPIDWRARQLNSEKVAAMLVGFSAIVLIEIVPIQQTSPFNDRHHSPPIDPHSWYTLSHCERQQHSAEHTADAETARSIRSVEPTDIPKKEQKPSPRFINSDLL